VRLTLEDRSDITELLSSYALLLDGQRVDEWMGLFVHDAVLEVDGSRPLSTREDREQLGRTAPPGTHLAAPPVIREGDAPDTAQAEQTFMFRDAESGRILAGWYEDVLVKVEGAWLFRHRTIRFHRAARGAT
jgi:hypothetical protein